MYFALNPDPRLCLIFTCLLCFHKHCFTQLFSRFCYCMLTWCSSCMSFCFRLGSCFLFKDVLIADKNETKFIAVCLDLSHTVWNCWKSENIEFFTKALRGESLCIHYVSGNWHIPVAHLVSFSHTPEPRSNTLLVDSKVTSLNAVVNAKEPWVEWEWSLKPRFCREFLRSVWLTVSSIQLLPALFCLIKLYGKLQYVTVHYSMKEYTRIQCSTVRYSTLQHATVHYTTQLNSTQYTIISYTTIQ